MKLIVNIPAYNEEADLGKTIQRIRKSFDQDFYSKEGAVISEKLIQVVDDGSTDNTAKVARDSGADIVVSYKPNRRLAYSFKQAVESSLKNGADFMVNIDADGQFDANDIPDLLSPVIKGEADMVIADRFGKHKAKNIPWIRSFFNRFAASVIGFFLNYKTNDLTCGFRAHSREAMLRLNLTNIYFTYTQETIIDAIGKNLKLKWVPIVVTYFDNREAKITKSIFKFISNSFKIILKAIRDVRPLKFFGWPGIFLLAIGFIGFAIFLVNYFLSFKISPYLNYIIFSAISTILGIQLVVFALIADMIKSSRQLTEELLYQWKKDKYNNQRP
ncbi:MAG TPA: glycosyltransferase family 2 protein [Candidatus Moranbacteria bacterium]|nr:glycosyltransferase family 2 protein [Candidatus Moranbacteria bacterium]